MVGHNSARLTSGGRAQAPSDQEAILKQQRFVIKNNSHYD